MKQKRLFNKFLPMVMLIVCSILGTTDAWAGGSTTYYAKVTAKLSTKNESGSGKVYASTTSTANASVDASAWKTDANGSNAQNSKKDVQVTLYINAMANPGYVFKGWSKTDGNTDLGTASPYTVNSGTSNISNSSRTYTECGPFYARFVPFTFGNTTPASVNIADAYAKHTYEGSVVIETNEATAIGNFNTPIITTTAGSGTFTYVSQTWAGGNLTINYRFNANGFVGTTTATLTAKTAGDVKTKNITLTATTLAPTITSGNAGAQLTPSTPTALAEGTATFNVTNAEDASYFAAPTFTNVQGGGTWKVVSTSYAAGVYTVNYTFQSDASHLGDHSADLTLTAAVGSATKTVTATAFTEAIATEDAKVTSSTGTLIYQGDWATALSKANTAANAGCTLTLLRNVDVTAAQSVTNTFTLDLNGKKLSNNALTTSITRVVSISTAGKTLTIKDSKSGGEIHGVGSANATIYGVVIDKGNLILNSGKIYCENTLVYNTLDASSKKQTGMAARGLHVAANSNFTMNGGEIECESTNSAFGIRQESSATATGEVHINGGTINANCKRQYAYAVYTLGKLFVDGGTINAKTYTSSGTSEAYGIYVSASANQTDASEYGGHLSISESSTVVINAQSQTSGAYAISVAGAYTCAKVDGAYTHTTARAYPASAEIHAGTFNAYSTTSGAYGLRVICSVKSVDETLSETVVKPTIVYGGTFNATAHTSSAFGIRADAVTSWAYGALERSVVEIYDANATAIAETGTDAYGAYVASAAGDYAMLHTENGDPGTKGGSYSSGYLDGGCYVVASKMTIHGGTFTGIAQTKTTAYGVCCQTRAIAADAIYDEEKGDYDKVAYPELIIEGGTFVGQTETSTTAGGLYTGGHTTVTGGSFSALPKTTTAYGVFVNAGTANISNATITATATSSAYGVYVNAGVAGTTGFCTFGEATLNNLSVTATTTTGNEADGVRIVTAQNTIPEAAKWNCHPGEYVCAGKATINGGTYNVTAAGTTAYGVCLNSSAPTILGNKVATGEAHMKDASFVVKTKGTTTAYGVHAGGLTSIDNCTFDVAAQTTSAYGIYAQDKECSVKNSTFTVNAGGNTAYGIYANASLSGYMRIPLESRVVSSNNKFTVVSGGTPAYGVYAHSAKMVQNATTWAALSDANKTTYPYPEKYAYGEWAVAGEVSLENDEFDVTAVGATARTIYTRGNCKPTETSEVSAMAKVTIDGGKYKATAATTQQEVFNETPKASDGYYPPEDGEPILIKGGFFKNEANLDFYKAPGLYVNKLKSGEDAEYAEGYRFEVGAPRFGTPVCKNGTKEYLTLEAALEDVNNGTVNGGTIVMTLPYTLPAGNYKIPSNTTLLVPYKSGTGKGATQAIGTAASTTNASTRVAPYCYLLLTIASGAHIDVYGTVEASAQQWALTGQLSGVVYGPYGQIHMEEGSSMSIESGARLLAWGYITGKGETTVHGGAQVYEDFQIFDWKGGTELLTNGVKANKVGVFPVNQYYIQNIEAPVIYRPGSRLRTSFHTTVGGINVGTDDVGIVGEWRSATDKDIAMFLMDAADESDDTWVRKEYDAENDVLLFTANSSAMISAIKITVSAAGQNMTVTSSDYDLPITNNMKVIVNSGTLEVTQHVQALPGASFEIYKEGNLQINKGCNLYMWDKDEWGLYAYSKKYIKPVDYSPSWKTCPRKGMDDSKVRIPDAEMFVHGTVTILGDGSSTGALYTTAGKANIHTTNSDAGKIIFQNTNAASGTNVYQWWKGEPSTDKGSYDPLPVVSAQLKNEDGSFTSTIGANNGKTYAYSEGSWQCWEQVGCYQVDKSDDANWKWYANPSDFVQVKSNETDNHVAPVMDEDHLYPSADETRFFILMDGCMWWEVSLVDDNLCYSEMNDTYYQWDGSKWVIKSFVITWKDWNGNTLDTYNNVKYRSMPKWLSATPTKAKQAGDPAGSYYIFSGWTPDLDIVTKDATYTATYELIVPKYDVLWKNEDGSKTLHISRWAEGEHPAYDGAEIKKATSMEGVDLAHNGWSTAAKGEDGIHYGLTDELPAMGTAAQTYYATFAEGWIISWFNEDGTLLDKKLWAAGTRPTHADINKESDEQYDYVFAGWTPEVLPVEADAEYTAVFTPVLRQYAITFSNLNGKGSSQVVNVDYGATPVCPVTPDRGNSAEYSYEWTGWKDGAGNTFGTDYVFPAVSGDATYTATFSQTTRTYTVTWKNEDGAVLERVRGLAVGDAVPDYSGATPEKEPTRYLTYGFTGWTPAKKATIDESGDQEYRATYDAGSTRYYTVRWLMDNGDLINETYLEYDQMPTHADPTKASTALYSYDFAGWTPAISAVKGDAEYKATFNAIHRQYEITYILYDDVKNVVRYQAEDAVATPTDPTREGYTFAGWDKEIPATMPAEDMTITANWTINTYTITFNSNGGSAVASIIADFGAPITKPANPTKTGYTFAAWDQEIPSMMPVGGMTLTASWTINTYTIRFENEGGALLQSVETEHGQTPAYTGTTPTKTATAEYTYTHNGWTPIIVEATENATYTATFAATKNKYTIRFENEGGALLQSVVVEHGQTPAYTGATPAKTATAEYTYTHNGWTPSIVAATANATYTATYTDTPKSYTLTWNLAGGEVTTVGTAAGSVAYTTELVAPVVERTGYTFNGWNPAVPATMPAANATYTAQWSANSYTITFITDGGTEIAPINGNYGDPISAPVDPTKTGYIFGGWEDPIPSTMPAENTTIKAIWLEIAAVVVNGTNETPYADLDEALSYVAAGNTLKLMKDINRGSLETALNQNMTLDLNGKTLTTQLNKISVQASIILTDSEGNGKISADQTINSDQNYIILIKGGSNPGASLTINGGSIEGYNHTAGTGYHFWGIDTNNAPVTMNGGSLIVKGGCNVEAIHSVVQSDRTDITINAGELHVQGGSTCYAYAINTAKVNTLTVTGGYFQMANSATLAAFSSPTTVSGGYYSHNTNVVAADGLEVAETSEVAGYNYTIQPETPVTSSLIIENAVVITENTTVQDLTIKENGSVTTSGSAKVTVVNNLFLEATPDNNLGAVLSGNFEVKENAFIDINMNGTGIMNKSYYYSFAVPFKVDVNGGVYRMEGDNAVSMTPGVGFLAYKYNEETRATKGTDDSAWEDVNSGIFEPGVFYLVQFSSNKSNTYRFQWNGEGSVNNHADISVTTTGNDRTNSGWHGVANNGLGYTSMSMGGDPLVMQTLNSAENKFEAMVGSQLAIGNPVFVQTKTGTIDLSTPMPKAAAAPRRIAAVEKTELMNVRLTREGADKHDDQIFFSANEDAENQYTIGRDVEKMFMGTAKTAQLWINAYGEKLVANEAVMSYDQATYNLGIYAPAAGDYVININENVNENVYLTYQGMPIWNLTMSEYSLHLEAGNTEGYGIVLQRAPQISTEVENSAADNNSKAQKFVFENKLYIVNGEHVFDGQGKLIK